MSWCAARGRAVLSLAPATWQSSARRSCSATATIRCRESATRSGRRAAGGRARAPECVGARQGGSGAGRRRGAREEGDPRSPSAGAELSSASPAGLMSRVTRGRRRGHSCGRSARSRGHIGDRAAVRPIDALTKQRSEDDVRREAAQALGLTATRRRPGTARRRARRPSPSRIAFERSKNSKRGARQVKKGNDLRIKRIKINLFILLHPSNPCSLQFRFRC